MIEKETFELIAPSLARIAKKPGTGIRINRKDDVLRLAMQANHMYLCFAIGDEGKNMDACIDRDVINLFKKLSGFDISISGGHVYVKSKRTKSRFAPVEVQIPIYVMKEREPVMSIKSIHLSSLISSLERNMFRTHVGVENDLSKNLHFEIENGIIKVGGATGAVVATYEAPAEKIASVSSNAKFSIPGLALSTVKDFCKLFDTLDLYIADNRVFLCSDSSIMWTILSGTHMPRWNLHNILKDSMDINVNVKELLEGIRLVASGIPSNDESCRVLLDIKEDELSIIYNINNRSLTHSVECKSTGTIKVAINHEYLKNVLLSCSSDNVTIHTCGNQYNKYTAIKINDNNINYTVALMNI